MNAKVLELLEFDKIIDKLSAHCATSMGREIAAGLKPAAGLEQTRRQLRGTDEAVLVNRLSGGLRFAGIRSIKPAVRRAAIGGMLSAEELMNIASTIGGGRKIKRFLMNFQEKEVATPILHALAADIADMKSCEDAIGACIDDNGTVMDSASHELYGIRRELRSSASRVREKLEQMIRSSSIQKMLQEQLITVRGDRFVIPVKQEYRGHFGGIVHDQSASGATLFIEPEPIVVLNNKIRELKLREEREIEKILIRLTAEVAGFADELTALADILAELDFIFAKAGLAHEWKATLPEVNDQGLIKLKKARHPLIPGKAVPLDIELGAEFTSVIITGPNTGGKTVTLKTIGLLSVMAMSGLFIPAEDGSRMCVFDGVYADIGDEQSIEQNLSTFSSHMRNIISILKALTPGSLVLLDELGAGTDPAEGSALAISILEHIHQTGCRLVATTHYSELKAYAYNRSGVINASMEFDVHTLSPTYRLLLGVPGRSNAFAIAERLGLDRSIIERARGQVSDEDRKVEGMIASLERDRLTAEAERKTAEQLRREVEKLRKELEESRKRFDDKKEKLLEQAQAEARQAVNQARREADEIISELRRMAMEEQASIKEHKLTEMKRRLEESAPKLKAPRRKGGGKNARIEPGDEVMVTTVNQKGHVIEASGQNEYLVQIGIMKIKVAKTDLEPIAQPKAPKNTVSAGATVKRTRDDQVRRELDLRGSNLEEALVETDRFLDEAFMANLGQVFVIHGKGTGVLRNGIHEYLRRHRLVKQYRLGNYGEGGNGVTVVEFK